MSLKKTKVGYIPEEWDIDIIDNIKSEEKNAIAMGPFGSNIKKENFVLSGVPVIRGNNLKDIKLCEDEYIYLTEEKAKTLKASLVKRGDIVITHRGTLGQVSYVPNNSKYDKYIVSQSGLKLTCDSKKVNSIFLTYFLNSRMGQYLLLMNKSQVGVPSIATPTTSIKKIPIPIPSLEEQNAITKILCDLDEKIEVNNQINKKLEEMAQAIFKRWFVDFEFPDENGNPYKSSGGEMIESDMGLIPKGWKIEELGTIIKVCSGKRPKEKNSFMNSDFTIPLIGASSVMGYVKEANFNNDILIIGRVGTLGIVQRFNGDIWASDNTLVIKTAYNEFVNQILNRIDYKSLNRGSTQPLITQGDIKKEKIILPSSNIIDRFEKSLESFFVQRQAYKKENNILIKIRDTLLPKLMSGEIRLQLNNEIND